MIIPPAFADEAVSIALSEDECYASAHTTGRLVPLRTKAEVEASFRTVDAYITEIPQKSANEVVKCVRRLSSERNG